MSVVPPDAKGLIFDIDGTLIDTMPLHYRSWQEALEPHGVSFPEPLFYELGGMPSIRIVETLNSRFGCSLSPRDIARAKRTAFLELLPSAQAIEPVVAIVRAYAGKLPMAAATGGVHAVSRRMLSQLDLIEHIQVIVTSEDVARGKPAPDTFLKAAQLIGVEPRDCIVFEDAELGFAAARKAGMRIIDVRQLAGYPRTVAEVR